MMSSTTNEALDLTLKKPGSRRVAPLIRQISVPDTTHISVAQLECRPLKIKERFALRYSMRSSSMDSSLLQTGRHQDSPHPGEEEEHTDMKRSEQTPLHITTDATGNPTKSRTLAHSRSANSGHSRSASATPNLRSPAKPPLIRYAHSLPEVESRQLLSVQEEKEVRDTNPRPLKGKRKTLLLPSLSADETGLPSPTKKPSPGASPNQTSGGTFFQCGPLDLSNLRKVPPISQIEEEEAEQRKVYLQQLQQLKDSIPNNPLSWRREEVHSWLAYMRLSHGLPRIRYERFLMNGKALTLMSQQMFLERVPCGGELLYRDFQGRMAVASTTARQATLEGFRTRGCTMPAPEHMSPPRDLAEPMSTVHSSSRGWSKASDSLLPEPCTGDIGRSAQHSKLLATSYLNKTSTYPTAMVSSAGHHSGIGQNRTATYVELSPNVATSNESSSFEVFRHTAGNKHEVVKPYKHPFCFDDKFRCTGTGNMPSIPCIPSIPSAPRIPVLQGIPRPVGLGASISGSSLPIFSSTRCSFLTSPLHVGSTKAISCDAPTGTFAQRNVYSNETSSPEPKQVTLSARLTSAESSSDSLHQIDVDCKPGSSTSRLSPDTSTIDISDSPVMSHTHSICSSADESETAGKPHSTMGSPSSSMDT